MTSSRRGPAALDEPPTDARLGPSEGPARGANVLVAAYACNPRRGSEEAVGWNWVQTIARSCRVTVLTAAFHADDIRAACDPDANPRFVFVPHRPWHYAPTPRWRAIESSIAKPIMNLAYAAWQHDACKAACGLLGRERFDLAHQLTYVGFRFPGRLWTLGLPFVWGPIGGLENTPWRLLPAMGTGGALYYAGRNLINSIQRRSLASPRRAAAAAGPGLIAATDSIARELELLYGAPSMVISEVVSPLHLSPSAARPRAPGAPLRVVWSGQHLPGKALNILLQALASLPPETRVELQILGDGPSRQRWFELARKLGIQDRCIWHGLQPRDAAMAIMAESHVLAITSLKDLTSTVLLEGLALGLPVVCPDHCGFSGVVTEACGVKIAPTSVKSLISGFAEALAHLEASEPARLELGRGALNRALDFGPDTLRAKLEAVYDAVMAEVPRMNRGS